MSLPYEPAARLSERFLHERLVTRIWDRDPSVWRAEGDDQAARSIASRLGWLDVPQTMPVHMDDVSALAEEARREQIQAVYLLGMGGSSLCAEVIRAVHGVANGFPDLFVLDSTDEHTLTAAAARLVPARTLFLVASKSGSTVEVTSMEQFFWSRVADELGPRTGRQFIAITDSGTTLQKLAATRGYRQTFINPSDIGGRFSALSLFGLVAAAFVGASPRDLLAAGTAMAEGCRQENHANAGLELGAFIAGTALAGRDKLTVILPPSMMMLGLWIEQLIAESTGKHGKGILPVVDEPLGRPKDYGQDRAFVALATDRDAPDAKAIAALEHAGHPVLHLTTRMDGLGSEFFRWEFATAVAGAGLGVNPFDEPNVAEAKAKTKSLLDAFHSAGEFPEAAPIASDDAVDLYTRGFAGSDPREVVRAALDSLQPGDYVTFLSYLPPSATVAETIADTRIALRARTRAATTFGVGPRYLHSTGQYHKGGPNSVLAFIITADDETQTEVPGAGYTFSVLKRAQALGDVQTLEAHGRRVLRIHLKNGEPEAVIARLFADAVVKT